MAAGEVADPDPGRGGAGGVQGQGAGQVAGHVVVAQGGQQRGAGAFGAGAEFLEDLADEWRFAGGVQVDRARVDRGLDGGAADLHERAGRGHEDVAGADEVLERRG